MINEHLLASQAFKATVLDVVSVGGQGKPWRALVQTSGEPKASYVVLNNPPCVGVGDDIHFNGVRINAGLDMPDQIIVDQTSAEARLALLENSSRLVGMTLSASQGDPSQAIEQRLGLRTLAAAQSHGLVDTTSQQGVTGVVRSRQSGDKVIQWVSNRFKDLHRPGVTLIAEPQALLPSRPGEFKRQGLARLLDYRQSLTAKAPENQTPERRQIIHAALPAWLHDNNTGRAIDDIDNTRPTHRGNQAMIGGVAVNLVIPYKAMETYADQALGLSGMYEAPYMPRKGISPLARAMITSAHEMAHSYQESLGMDYSTPHGIHKAECYADAASLVCYVLETGDDKSARKWTALRAISALQGVDSHSTGLACSMAIKTALELRKHRTAQEVPIETILKLAVDIAGKTAIAVPQDTKDVAKAIATIDPEWLQSDTKTLAATVNKALHQCGHGQTSRLAAQFHLAVQALPQAFFLPHQLENASVRQEALAVERADIVETLGFLASNGNTDMIAPLLETASRRRTQDVERFVTQNRVTNARSRIESLSPRLAAMTQELDKPLQGRLVDRARLYIRQVVGSFLLDVTLATTPRLLGTQAHLASQRSGLPSLKTVLSDLQTKQQSQPRQLFTVVENTNSLLSQIPDVFDKPVAERMRLLGEMLFKQVGILKQQHDYAPENQGKEQFLELEKSIGEIAFSLMVDSQTRQELSKRNRGMDINVLSALANDWSRRQTSRDYTPISSQTFIESFQTIRLMLQQEAVREDLASHSRWLSEPGTGTRLDWSGRDLQWMDMQGMNLAQANLAGCDFTGTNLKATNMSKADLSGVVFKNSMLDGTILQRARMSGADFNMARAYGAKFGGAVLDGANFENANLINCDMRQTSLLWTNFKDANLRDSRFNGASVDRAFFDGARETSLIPQRIVQEPHQAPVPATSLPVHTQEIETKAIMAP